MEHGEDIERHAEHGLLLYFLLDLTGVLAAFTTPLRPAKVPIFATSTWYSDWIAINLAYPCYFVPDRDTDYVLVTQEKIRVAVHALENDGWVFPASAGEK